jgi:hypothetical protein
LAIETKPDAQRLLRQFDGSSVVGVERTVLRNRPEDADVDGGEERAQSMSAC